MLESALSPAQGSDWVEMLPARTYHTPTYGTIPITKDKLSKMVSNYAENVRGQEIAINFDHGMDKAKGNAAAGWIKDLQVRPSSSDPNDPALWAKIDWTNEAMSELKDKKWKYMSLEWDDEWMANDGSKHNDVVVGAALTNRPIAKKMMPINFSEAMWDEVDESTRKEFAVWTQKYEDSLPDSAFLYKDANGRHLPYKDANGKVDLAHLRNAIARAGQVKGISASTVASLQNRARRILAGMQKAMSEDINLDVAQSLLEVAEMSSSDWGHQDPGIDAPLIGNADQPDPGTAEFIPRVQGDPTTEELDIGSGSRREDIPLDPDAPGAPDPNGLFNDNEGGEKPVTPEELKKFFDDLLKHVSDADRASVSNAFSESVASGDSDAVAVSMAKVFGEWAALKAQEYRDDEDKRFAEQFPNVWREQQALIGGARATAAKAFSESVSTVKRTEGSNMVATKQNLSALALDTIANAHKAFSEGTGTVEIFEGAIKAITDGGLVPVGEFGSSRAGEVAVDDLTTLHGIQAAKQRFSDAIDEVRTEDEFKDKDYRLAFAEAAKRFPDLAAAYNHTPVVQTT